MATTRATAKRLATAAEYELVEASFAPAINALDPKILARNVQRTRRLRDKARTVAQGQAREMQGKADPRGQRPARANALTVAKQKLLDETLARFEKRLAALKERGERKSQTELAKKAMAMKQAAGGDEDRPASRTASKGMKSKPAENRTKGHFPAEGTKKGVVSAAIKRGQARRDSRGG